jgi:hypothetical protein
VRDNGDVDLKLTGVPTEVVRSLKAAAKFKKVSFNDYLLELCQQYAERHRRMREPSAALDGSVARRSKLPSSVPLVRQDRERR